MVKNRKDRWILVACLAVAGFPVLAFCATRNGFWESCTTKAYGLPLPWYVDHCLCERGQLAVNPLFCAVNLAVWVGPGIVLAWGIGKMKRSRANEAVRTAGR